MRDIVICDQKVHNLNLSDCPGVDTSQTKSCGMFGKCVYNPDASFSVASDDGNSYIDLYTCTSDTATKNLVFIGVAIAVAGLALLLFFGLVWPAIRRGRRTRFLAAALRRAERRGA